MKKEYRIERILEAKIENKADISRDYMIAYVMTFGDVKDQKWLKELFVEHQVVRNNNVRKGEQYKSVDLGETREAFCRRFEEFYHLSTEARANARKAENDLFGDFMNTDFGEEDTEEESNEIEMVA